MLSVPPGPAGAADAPDAVGVGPAAVEVSAMGVLLGMLG
jgi:hypothetical protein